jgi:hypothetical protein
MGTSYHLVPLDAKVADWLVELAVPLPDVNDARRPPTLRDVRDAVASLDDYEVRESVSAATGSLDMEVVDRRGYWGGWSTTLWVKAAEGDQPSAGDDAPVGVTFHKGSPELAVLIAERLTRVCGPLVLIEASEALPLVVRPGIDAERAVSEWLR